MGEVLEVSSESQPTALLLSHGPLFLSASSLESYTYSPPSFLSSLRSMMPLMLYLYAASVVSGDALPLVSLPPPTGLPSLTASTPPVSSTERVISSLSRSLELPAFSFGAEVL